MRTIDNIKAYDIAMSEGHAAYNDYAAFEAGVDATVRGCGYSEDDRNAILSYWDHVPYYDQDADWWF